MYFYPQEVIVVAFVFSSRVCERQFSSLALLMSLLSMALRRPIISAMIAATLCAQVALAGDIYVDGVACQLADAITAANTDQAMFGCVAGDGADNLILLRDIPLQLGALPSITSDITIISSGVVIQACVCGENDPDDPEYSPIEEGEPEDTATPTAPADTATPTAPADTATPTAPAYTATPILSAGTATPTAPAGTATPTPSAGTATPTASAGSATPPALFLPESAPPETDDGKKPLPRSECVHVVARGENLFRIALQYNMTVRRFSSYNNLLSDDKLVEGQELIIPVDACQQYLPYKG